MKSSLFLSEKAKRSRHGIALITVLILVVLITTVIVGFLITSRLEQTAARSYKASGDARIMADTAINLVQAQINEATSQGINYAWASQPGAIRVFDNAGALHEIYRLYSAQKLTATTSADMDTSATSAGSNDMPPTTWATSPSGWVDLNAPANDGAGNAHYPIFDAGKAANVDGFSIGSNAPNGTTSTQVPMPVTWLYVLQKGEIIAPDAGGTTIATFTNASVAPSTANPIVGRIAFWTDDETCKVNVNTAAGDGIGTTTAGAVKSVADATFWDIPRYSAQDDQGFSVSQPATGEFQRYPGHPGAVSLHNILNGLGWTALTSPNFYSLTPRYGYGGSEGGKISSAPGQNETAIPLKASPQNRLYSSVSEMLFNYDRTQSAINANNTATQQMIETAGFFLTAHSHIPEVTLFGQPRISVWPVMDATATHGQRTAADNLLAFAATQNSSATGGKAPYYFTRSDPASSTTDVSLPRNQTLLNYLDYFTSQPIPGYGGNFDSKYKQSGARQILTEIFDYIRTVNIADSSQPLVGGLNTTEYAFPWIPSSVYTGLYQVAPSLQASWGTQGIGIYPRLTEAAVQFVAMGRGALPAAGTPAQVAIPLDPAYKAGALNLLIAGDSGTDPNGTPPATKNVMTLDSTLGSQTYNQLVPPGNTARNSASTTAVQACLLLSFTNPSQMLITNGTAGGSNIVPYVAVDVAGLDGFTLKSQIQNTAYPLGFPSDANMIIQSSQYGSNIGDNWDAVDFTSSLYARSFSSGPLQNPFLSKIIPIATNPGGGGTGQMTCSGGTITVKLYDGTGGVNGSANAKLVQTYTIIFPPVTTNIPTVSTQPWTIVGNLLGYPGAPALVYGPSIGVSTSANDRWSAAQSVALSANAASQPNFMYIVGDGDTVGDVVESMVLSPTWSDPRLLAIANVPSAAFVKHPNWGKNFAYGFFYGSGPYYSLLTSGGTTFTPGAINPNANYLGGETKPIFPNLPRITPTVTNTSSPINPQLADWDTGLGSERDGPWVNKADEGVVFMVATPSKIPYFSPNNAAPLGASFFSPNREIPSPGMLGSLPTGVDPTGTAPAGWRTLLFRPCPGHFGENSPEDHLMLDLFWMPAADPYAISEPFSSAGKINLNYQIQPFTYITRSTGIRAVLNAQKIAQVPVGQALLYKSTSLTPLMSQTNARAPVNATLTLTQFQDKFDGTDTSSNNASTNPDIFHSASQVCDMYLVPQGASSVSQFATQWNDGKTYGLCGDNVKERPYANIYGQVTTKSNTYTVYYTVQSLKNAEPQNLQNQWNESQGVVLGENRGSTTLERYIDPNQALPDFAANSGTSTPPTVESFYKWRVVENHQFAP